MSKCKIFIIICVLLIIICSPICYIWYISHIDVLRKYGEVELFYFSTQYIISIFTALAVIVALFGSEIKSFFIKEHCNVFLVNSGFYENLGRQINSYNPVAQSYDCYIGIINDGGKMIENLEIILKEVFYSQTADSRYKRIFASEHKALYWDTPEIKDINLLQKETRKIPLFKIYPESSCITPDDSSSSQQKMRIIGANIDEKYWKKGKWKAVYEVRSHSKVLLKFETIAEWNGKWCNRSTEMDDQVSATIKLL